MKTIPISIKRGAKTALDLLCERVSERTSAETRFDAGTRAIYASEASNYRQVPLGVVLPKTLDDLAEVVALCGELNLPVLPRGAGTSMCGQSVNAAVCVDHSRWLTRVEEIDPVRRVAVVQPGVICDQLKDAAAAHGLTFGPDPATHTRCTLGGMIGNNSCGAHSVMAGKTVENIQRLEVATTRGARFWVGETDEAAYAEHVAAGGERARIAQALRALVDKYEHDIRSGFPKLKRRVSGYNLDQLLPENGFNIARALVGSEGTCATVLRAETLLVEGRAQRKLLVLGFDSIFDAADSVPTLLPLSPIAMEGLDHGIIGGLKARGLRLEDIAELPPGNAWLFVEFGAATEQEAQQMATRAALEATALSSKPSSLLVPNQVLMNRLWSIRETGASATSLSADPDQPDPTVGWEDAAVEPSLLGPYLREFSALVDAYGYKTNMYGHFGDGCIHSRITFDLRSERGIKNWRAFLEAAAKLVVKYKGSLSGEHGDGQAKGEFLPLMYSPRLLDAFREFKAIWDPAGIMNPGKLIDAMRVDENLKYGPEYRRPEVSTAISFGTHGFARETERCIGMAKCRSVAGGTMCPSFKATREERYSTRGRARLFFEMLNGEVVKGGWKDEDVKASMDMCLACKGCKSDCPTHVDIPKYRSEFLYHYYQSKLRSPMDALIGRIGQWLPAATFLSKPINSLMGARTFRSVGHRFGLAREASFPEISNRPFRRDPGVKHLSELYASTALTPGDVLIWTDTFNNGFTPEVLHAAVQVVERVGKRPRVTTKHVCCGRPFYDVGMLDKARESLLNVLDELSPVIEANVPILVLEPSCLSVFRDELPAMLPNDPRARQIADLVVTVGELAQSAGLDVGENVVVHPHCHQRACGGVAAEKALGASVLDSGCCGMAGAFGYHRSTHEVSQRVAELELLPKLAKVPATAALVADGFSCRSQIAHTTGRSAEHLAVLLARKLQGGIPPRG